MAQTQSVSPKVDIGYTAYTSFRIFLLSLQIDLQFLEEMCKWMGLTLCKPLGNIETHNFSVLLPTWNKDPYSSPTYNEFNTKNIMKILFELQTNLFSICTKLADQ